MNERDLVQKAKDNLPIVLKLSDRKAYGKIDGHDIVLWLGCFSHTYNVEVRLIGTSTHTELAGETFIKHEDAELLFNELKLKYSFEERRR